MKTLQYFSTRIILLLVAFFNVYQVYSQIIPAIPTAQQQPKWFFPVFVEDATGAKDTIYMGYDPLAEAYFDDTIFGEFYYPMDSGLFKPCVYDFNGTYVDVHIRDSSSFVVGAFYLELFNTVFPIKIWWDDISRLRSDSLPFPDPPMDAPRGQIIFEIGSCGCILTNPGKNAWGGQIIISDTSQVGFDTQTIEDTVFFADPFNDPNPRWAVISIYFKKWTGTAMIGVNEIVLNEIKLFPNPVSDILYITGNFQNGQYLIYDLNGKEIISGKIISNKISVDFLTKGIYLLKISSDNNFSAQKFIKS